MPEGSSARSNSALKTVPEAGGLPLLGSIVDFRRKGPLQFWMDAWHELGDVLCARMGPVMLYQFVRPEHVHHILVKNPGNYVKGRSHDKLRIPLGSGILTAEGEEWRHQRRVMGPTFTPRAVTQFGGVIIEATRHMLERWQVLPGGEPLAINVEMMRLAMSVISRSMFTIDIGEDFNEAGEALSFILEFASERTLSLIDPPMFLPTPMNRRLERALETVDNFLYGIIAERREEPAGDDLLSILMHARDPNTGEAFSERELRDEMLIIFFAGHETTAQLLTWAWYLLARHPEVEAKLHDELGRVLGGRTPAHDDLDSLPYMKSILDETLRLYSPVAMLARDTVTDDEIDGYPVPAGSIVTITPYITHRHPEFWKNPGRFDPEHFSSEQANTRPRYAYYPFGAGPRICLGQYFALEEASLVLAEVAQRYRLRRVDDRPVAVHWSSTLRPERDVMVTLEPR